MRGEKYLASIQNVYLLLCDIVENPKNYISDEKWMAMVQTIFTMCAFDDPTLNIAKCAPNTFKRNATNTILGGFPEVDRQRKLAKESLLKASARKVSKKTDSRRTVAKENKDQIIRLQRLETSFAQMQIVIQDLRELSYQLAHDDTIPNKPNYFNRCMHDINLIFQLIGDSK